MQPLTIQTLPLPLTHEIDKLSILFLEKLHSKIYEFLKKEELNEAIKEVRNIESMIEILQLNRAAMSEYFDFQMVDDFHIHFLAPYCNEINKILVINNWMERLYGPFIFF